MTFQLFLLILRARLWVVFGTLVVVVGTALAVSLLLPSNTPPKPRWWSTPSRPTRSWAACCPRR